MRERDNEEEINDLLATASKLAETASRRGLTVASHLLGMLQLELTMVIYGYSDPDDPAASEKSPAPPKKAGPPRRTVSLVRRR